MGVGLHPLNSRIQEAEAGRSLLEVSLVCTVSSRIAGAFFKTKPLHLQIKVQILLLDQQSYQAFLEDHVGVSVASRAWCLQH